MSEDKHCTVCVFEWQSNKVFSAIDQTVVVVKCSVDFISDTQTSVSQIVASKKMGLLFGHVTVFFLFIFLL